MQLIKMTAAQFSSLVRECVRIEIELLHAKMKKKESKFLTRKETAQLLQIDLSTLWSWSYKEKILEPRKAGRRIYYVRKDVEELLTNPC